MKTKYSLTLLIVTYSMLLLGPAQSAQLKSGGSGMGYEDTPMLPGGKWHVHDAKRPQPVKVTAGTCSAQEHVGRLPSDAEVLFNGKDLSKWKDVKGGSAKWTVRDGYMEVLPGTGDIYTREEFGDIQLHVEWRTPTPLKPGNVWQGNSGVFLFGVYELQVFESSRPLIYADGGAGAIYGQYPPLANPARDPGQWQVYDIIFNPARFKEGKLQTPAYITVFENGVVVQNHTAIMGETGHRIFPHYVDRGPKGPIRLQDHGDLVRYRNIWVRQLKLPD
jgi:3-keto-disaccharide hydrolase